MQVLRKWVIWINIYNLRLNQRPLFPTRNEKYSQTSEAIEIYTFQEILLTDEERVIKKPHLSFKKWGSRAPYHTLPPKSYRRANIWGHDIKTGKEVKRGLPRLTTLHWAFAAGCVDVTYLCSLPYSLGN
jgi:hypothetical protein